MDLGVAPISGGSPNESRRDSNREEPPARRAAVGATDADLAKLVSPLAKQVLSNSLNIRTAMSCLLKVVLIQENNPVVATVKSMTKAYSDKLKEMTPEERKNTKHGPHHRHAWNGFITATKAMAMKSQDGAPLVTVISQYCEKYQVIPEAMDDQCRHCSVANAYRKDVKKLQICTVPGSDSDVLASKMIEYRVKYHKAEVKQGRAPQGDLERRIQEMIDSMHL